MDRARTQYVFAIIIALLTSALLFSLLLYSNLKKEKRVLSYADREVEQVFNTFGSGHEEESRKAFREITETARGGEQWMLLQMAILDNKDKEYDALKKNDVPDVQISIKQYDPRNKNIVMEVRIINSSNVYMNVKKVPSRIKWIFSDNNGVERIIEGDLQGFGEPDKDEVIRLNGNHFIGVNIPVSTETLAGGAWDIYVRLIYEHKELNGLNIVHGEFCSNREKIVL